MSPITVRGFSLVETLVTLGLFSVLTAITVPPLLGAIDEFRAAGAAAYMSSRLQDVRMQAVSRSRRVALQFQGLPDGYGFRVVMDGNYNGVTTHDIQNGADPEVEPLLRLRDLFRDVDFGTLPGLPAVDPGGAPPGDDPIHLGGSNILTFTSHGTSSTGSLYLHGKGPSQYAIRIYGDTGKTRVLKYSWRTGQWLP